MKKTTITLALLFFCINLSANIQPEFMYKAHKAYKTKNYKEAIDLYNRGCYMGFSEACVSLGNMYMNGDGVKTNIKKAKRYLNISCNRGDTISCDLLAKEKHKKLDKIKKIKAEKMEIEKIKAEKIKRRLQEANFFMRNNIPLNKARKWKEAGFTASDALYYITNNISISEAKQLINN
ncbi:MAG: hypothetical protein L3J10_04990 [Sulfurimonas sp.]|nr:hypothetical protein [Sulfurimonas sp.]